MCVTHLTREEDRRGHLLHSQVADAGGEGGPAGRAAAQLVAALVAHEVSGLALQDGGQHIVKAHGTLEQRCELVVLLGYGPGDGRRRRRCWKGCGDRAGDCRGRCVRRRRRWQRRLLFSARFVSTRSGRGRAAHGGPRLAWKPEQTSALASHTACLQRTVTPPPSTAVSAADISSAYLLEHCHTSSALTSGPPCVRSAELIASWKESALYHVTTRTGSSIIGLVLSKMAAAERSPFCTRPFDL